MKGTSNNVSKELPSLFKNITASSISQIGIYLANLASLPYLARILGTDGLGQVVYIQSIMAIIILIVDFGFSWSAIKRISSVRDDKAAISNLFFSIWIAQWFLTIFLGTFLFLITLQTEIIQASNKQIIFGYLIVAGYVLFPFWLLHGTENIRASTIIQLISKLFTIPILFYVVQSPADIDSAILFFAFCNLLAGFIFLFYVLKFNILKWKAPSINEIAEAYKFGWHTFLAKANISLCSLLVPIYVNIISGPSALGIYSLSDKVKNLIISITGPISTALFPRMSLLAKGEKKEFIILGLKAAVWQLALLAPICFSIWFFATEIAILVGGNQFMDATSTIRWLVFLPLITATSNILGIQIMLPIGMEKTFSKINFGGLIIVTVLTFTITPSLQADGAAISLFITEILLLALMAYRLRKINFWRQ